MKLRNVRLNTLRLAVDVAETGSMTIAAHVNNMAQATVSINIRNLEDTLGFPLFERDMTHGARRAITGVTDRGKPVIRHFRRVLETIEELETGEKQ